MKIDYKSVPKGYEDNLKWRRECLRMVQENPGWAGEFMRICEDDLLFYVNTFCWTYDPRPMKKDIPRKLPFITYPYQDEAMLQIVECIESGRDFAMPKSRDMGASWMGLTVFEWLWHFRESMSFLMMSRKEELVDKRGDPKSLFWKIDFIHEHQPKWMLPSGRWLGWNDPERKLMHIGNVDTGSVIDGETTTENAGVGDRRTAMFIDEFGAFETDAGYAVLRGTRDITPCRGFNSTPRGQNAFYEVVTKTSALVIRMHWSKHPEKAKGLYTAKDGKLERLDNWSGRVDAYSVGEGEKERKTVRFPEEYKFILDGKLRSPWYDLQRSRCVSDKEIAQELDIDFLGSEYPFFDPPTIDALKVKYCMPPMGSYRVEIDAERCEVKRIIEDQKGDLKLWFNLDRNDHVPGDMQFVLGADVSAGTGASNSVCSFVNKATGEKCGLWKSPYVLPNDFARMAVALAKFFNRCLMVWDASGATGVVFTRKVVQIGYGYIYFRRNEKKIGRDISDEPGVYLNPKDKQALMEDYRDALGTHRFINRSASGMEECLQFIRFPDGTIEHSSAARSQDPSGARTAHGDEVVADALACLGMTDNGAAKIPEEFELPVGSLAYRMREKAKESAGKGIDKLGEGW